MVREFGLCSCDISKVCGLMWEEEVCEFFHLELRTLYPSICIFVSMHSCLSTLVPSQQN